MSVACCLIVILQVAFLPLESSASAVIVALPALRGHTTPLLSTVAIFLLLLLHLKSITPADVPSANSALKIDDKS